MVEFYDGPLPDWKEVPDVLDQYAVHLPIATPSDGKPVFIPAPPPEAIGKPAPKAYLDSDLDLDERLNLGGDYVECEGQFPDGQRPLTDAEIEQLAMWDNP